MLKYIVIGLLFVSSPVYAKHHKHHSVVQNQILATSYLVQDLDSGEVIAEKNSSQVRSIASITKLMTAMVVLDANQDLDEVIHVPKGLGLKSRTQGSDLPRSTLMVLSLMSSDNLATMTLAMNYPGGLDAAISAMNVKAQALHMLQTHFDDPTGLDPDNVSSSQDLAKMLEAAESYPYITYASTNPSKIVEIHGKDQFFHTTNRLVNSIPDVVVSKTGWIHQSGGCLIMNIRDQGRRLAVVLLNSRNTHTRLRDGELLYGLQHGTNI